MQRRATIAWLLRLFSPVTALFYWKTLLTRQFSLLTASELVNQGVLLAAIRDRQHQARRSADLGPLHAGRGTASLERCRRGPFVIRFHLLLALVPFNSASVLSAPAYHIWFALTHVLAACFMFALVRDFGLSRFSAFVAGLCFSLGGVVAGLGWLDFLESSIWLPLVFLFFRRALRAVGPRLAITGDACIGGLMPGKMSGRSRAGTTWFSWRRWSSYRRGLFTPALPPNLKCRGEDRPAYGRRWWLL